MEPMSLDTTPVSDDTPLFRIIDLHELLDIARNNRFRIPSAGTFSDINELLGVWLHAYDSGQFHPLSEVGLRDRIANHHKDIWSYFVSSWTLRRDSIAMWELYSRDVQSVQISATLLSIRTAFDSYFDSNKWVDFHGTPCGTEGVRFYPLAHGQCVYTSFDQLVSSIEARYAALAERLRACSESQQHRDEFGKFDGENTFSHSIAEFLKDQAYSHEEEYRFVAHAVKRSPIPWEECAAKPFNVLFNYYLSPVTPEDNLPQLFVPFPASKILTVYLDGRLPPWKLDVQQRLLHELGLRVEVSPAYGYFFDHRSVKVLMP